MSNVAKLKSTQTLPWHGPSISFTGVWTWILPLVGHLANIPSDSVPEAELEAVKACKDFSPPLHFLHTIILFLHQGCPLDHSPLLGQTSDRALRLQNSQVIQVVGWFPAMVVLSQGEFCLLFSSPTNGIFIYLWEICSKYSHSST